MKLRYFPTFTKTKLKVDFRPKFKTRNYKTPKKKTYTEQSPT